MRRLIPSLFAGAALAAVGLGCGGGSERVGITVQDILDEPTRYVGRTVTLHGEIAESHGAHWFTIDTPGVVDDEMLIYSPDPQDTAEGREIVVTGEVVTLVVSEVEREWGIDLEPELEVEYSDQPIAIAENVVFPGSR